MLIRHFPFRGEARPWKEEVGPPRECQQKAALWESGRGDKGRGQGRHPGPWAGGYSCPVPGTPWAQALLAGSSGRGPVLPVPASPV